MSTTAPASDPSLEAALKATLQLVIREHALTANQILILASELQRVGVHQLVEEHLDRAAKRPAGKSGDS